MKPDTAYSLENERWMSIRHMADAVVNQTLAEGLTRLGIAWRVDGRSVEIDAYTRDHIMAFSDASKAIDQNLRAKGYDPQTAGTRLRRVANLTTRLYKRVASLAAIEGSWAAKAARLELPVFSPNDGRLWETRRLAPALTAAQAVDRALERARELGKPIYGDFHLLRHAIEISAYRTSHEAIGGELRRQLATGELLRTPSGILRRTDALELARVERAETVSRQQATLRSPESLERLDRLLRESGGAVTPAERANVAAALKTSSLVTLDSPESATRFAAALVDLAVDQGLTAMVVSGTGMVSGSASRPASDQMSVERARVLLPKLGARHVVVQIDGPATSTPAWQACVHTASQRGVVLMRVRTQAPDSVGITQRQAPPAAQQPAHEQVVEYGNAAVPGIKSTQLAELRQRLAAARALLRAEPSQSSQAALPQRQRIV